jgi:hypothetical protein
MRFFVSALPSLTRCLAFFLTPRVPRRKNPMQAMRRPPSSANAISALLLIRCMACDLFTRKRVYVAYTYSTVAFLLFVFGAIFDGMIRPWLAIAQWITSF